MLHSIIDRYTCRTPGQLPFPSGFQTGEEVGFSGIVALDDRRLPPPNDPSIGQFPDVWATNDYNRYIIIVYAIKIGKSLNTDTDSDTDIQCEF